VIEPYVPGADAIMHNEDVVASAILATANDPGRIAYKVERMA
jgi:hypothetical protein